MRKKKSISEKLKEHLSSITPEQFDKEWAEIEAMGFTCGPTVEEFLSQPKMTSDIIETRFIMLLIDVEEHLSKDHPIRKSSNYKALKEHYPEVFKSKTKK